MSRRLVLLALVVPLAFAACGDDSNDADSEALSDTSGGTHVVVSLTDNGCDPLEIDTIPGKVTFDVTNEASSRVTAFAVLRTNGDVVGEVEDVNRGDEAELTLDLDEGDYLTRCAKGNPETGTLHVGNADSGENGTTTTLEPPTPGAGGDEADTGH